MAKKIVVDPITRIEGHLRIEAQIEGNKIAKAWSSSTMFRGIETILKGRDPARCPPFHPALLRGLHHRALHRQHPLRRGCAEDPDPGQRPPDPQSDHGIPEHAGPRHPFLPPACPRLGRHHRRPQGRPGQDRQTRPVDLRLAEVERHLLQGGPGAHRRLRRHRAPRPLPERLLGASAPTSCLPRPT